MLRHPGQCHYWRRMSSVVEQSCRPKTTDPEKARPYIAPTMAEDAYNKGECMIWTDGTIKRANRDGVVHDPDILPVAWDTV